MLKRNQNEDEAINYQLIFSEIREDETAEERSMHGLRTFVPQFFGSVSGVDEVTIELENLLFDVPMANYMDIKLGTSLVTKSCREKGPAKIASRKLKASSRTAIELGFTICGYSKKDQDSGDTIEHLVSNHVKKEEVSGAIAKIMSNSQG